MPVGQEHKDYLFGAAAKLSDVFNTHPTAGLNNQLWFQREALERDLAYALGNTRQHVCIDGPSGTGKTSLAQRVLTANKRPFIMLQVWKGMTWPQFCRRFVDIPETTKRSSRVALKGVLDLFRPGLSGEIQHSISPSAKNSYDLLRSQSETWTPIDVGLWLERNRLSLIVDDFENASGELLTNIAALSKLIGQTCAGRIIVIGTDDILLRLVRENTSLPSRVSEVTVGGLGGVSESAAFLTNKFKMLGVHTPFTDKSTSRELRSDLAQRIYDAASGLLKELNELGLQLGREISRDSKWLTEGSIRAVCAKITRDKYTNHRKKITAIITAIERHSDLRDVMIFLAKRGAAEISSVAEIQDEFANAYSDNQNSFGA